MATQIVVDHTGDWRHKFDPADAMPEAGATRMPTAAAARAAIVPAKRSTHGDSRTGVRKTETHPGSD